LRMIIKVVKIGGPGRRSPPGPPIFTYYHWNLRPIG
jgi:hypothetical protein